MNTKFLVNSSIIVKRSMSGITSAKRALRKEIESVIGKLSKEEKALQSSKVAEKLLSLPEYKKSKRISVYLSTDNEINTLPFLADIFNNDKEVFVPRYRGKEMRMVKLNSLDDYDKLPLTKWNIKQPAASDMREDALETGGLDLVIIPGVGFTVSGKRLGHGMGYYDKFLANCIASQKKKPHLIAVAFNEQIRQDIPTNENDVTLDAIITDKYYQ